MILRHDRNQTRRLYVYNCEKQLLFVTADYPLLLEAAEAVSDWLLFQSGVEYKAKSIITRLSEEKKIGGKYGYFITDRHIYKSKNFYLTKHKGELNQEILKDIGVISG